MNFVIPPLSEVKHRLKEPLYRNSFFLMVNNGLGGVLGFIFWIIAARFYSPSQVGIVGALLAAMMLVSSFSKIGFDMSIIRFLSDEEDKQGMINSCLTITSIATLIFSLIFAAGLNFWSPALSFLHQNIAFLISFVLFTVAWSLLAMLNSIFIALRRAEFSLFQNAMTAVLRPVLPILVVSAGTLGLFFSWGIGMCLAIIISLFLFLPRLQPKYHPLLRIKKVVVNDMMHYSLMNYFATLLENVPKHLLPLLVINMLGSDTTAYFRIAWAVSSILFLTIPVAIAASLFAEGSYNPGKLHQSTIRAMGLMLGLVITGIAIIFLFGDKILLLFGTAYLEKGLEVLRILVLSSIPIVFIQLYFVTRMVQMRMKSVVFMEGLTGVLVLGMIFALVPRYGIVGVSIGWTLSYTIIAVLIGAILLMRRSGWPKLQTMKKL